MAAIGSPFGQEQSLSVGVVSASDRSIESLTDFGSTARSRPTPRSTPATPAGRCSTRTARSIGINQQIKTASGGNEGVGFAVPIDLAQRSIDAAARRRRGLLRLHRGHHARRSTRSSPRSSASTSTPGALVSEVVDGGPADEAGLQGGDDATIRFQAQEVDAGGDVIVAVDGEPIDAEADLPRLISLAEPGDEVTLDIIRDGERRSRSRSTLGERPVEVPRP